MMVDRNSECGLMYLIEAYCVSIEVYLYCGSESVLDDVFDPAYFPLVFIVGIDIVIFSELLVEVVILELGCVLSEHLLCKRFISNNYSDIQLSNWSKLIDRSILIVILNHHSLIV